MIEIWIGSLGLGFIVGVLTTLWVQRVRRRNRKLRELEKFQKKVKP
jgi:hypothetical protein